MKEQFHKLLESCATPALVINLQRVRENCRRFVAAFPSVKLHYAVKANPHVQILRVMHAEGLFFDTASLNEIADVLRVGANPDHICFGSPIKKRTEIQAAHDLKVPRFAFDSREELVKIAEHAPGAEVYCRLAHSGQGSAWPLYSKFGCSPDMAIELLGMARGYGLRARGISFHVGSQQRDPQQWLLAIRSSAQLFFRAAQMGLDLSLLNIGGGFPVQLRDPVVGIEEVGEQVEKELRQQFGDSRPEVMAEPGRALVADAGAIVSEVVLSTRRPGGPHWVYLDVGKFGGLAETMDELIQYRIETLRPLHGESVPVVLAGPTCDSADILYQKAVYHLPSDICDGERVLIHGTGAYTASYSAVGFNGYKPLSEHFVGENPVSF